MTGQEQLKLARETVADKAALLAEIKTDLRALNGKLRQKNARVLVINEENKHLDDVLKTMMEEVRRVTFPISRCSDDEPFEKHETDKRRSIDEGIGQEQRRGRQRYRQNGLGVQNDGETEALGRE